MAGNDIYSILMGSEPEAADSARAMANAIRRNRNFAMGSGLGAADPLGAMGKSVADFGKQDEGLMEKASLGRLHYAPQAEEMAARKAMYADPQARKILGGIGKALAPRIAGEDFGNMDPRMQMQLIPGLEKVGIADQANATKLLLGQRALQDRDDKHEQNQRDAAQKDIVTFAKEIDAAKQARSALGVSAQNVYRAQAAMPLLEGKMIPPQFLHDVAINLARIAGSGGNIGEEMARRLEATGLKADAARIESYLTSHPVDTNMRGWVDLLSQKMKQEEDVADRFQRHSAIKQLSAQSRAAKYAPEDLKRVVDAAGLTDFVQDDLLTPVGPGGLAGIVGKTHISTARGKLQPGERLAFDRDGRAHALAPGEAVPAGMTEVK